MSRYSIFDDGEADPLEGDQEYFPEWNWDRVRTWVSIRRADDYSDDQIRVLAGHDVVMLEKMNGHVTHGCIERGALHAAKRIKAINPKTLILFYLNSMVHYGRYKANHNWQPEWAARNRKGELVKWVNDKYLSYDHTNLDFREWWIQRALDDVSNEEIDGIFVDAICKTTQRFLPEGHADAYFETANELRSRLPEGKLLIGNAIRAGATKDDNFSHLKYLDGSYLENWDRNDDKIVTALQAMDAALKAGRAILFKGYPFHLDEAKFKNILTLDERYAYLSNPKFIGFPLALFLMIVQPYAYFTYRSDVDANPAKLAVFDSNKFEAITRALGRPMGGYKQIERYVFTREFEHLLVRVNIQQRIGKIIVKGEDEEENDDDSGEADDRESEATGSGDGASTGHEEL